MYEPSTNKDQKNTKAWVQCMPLFFFFSRMSASAFQRFDSCSAVKQKPFGKLIRLSKLFRFFDASQCEKFNIPLARTGKFTNMSFCLPLLPSVTRGLLLEQVQRGAVDFFYRGLFLLLRKRGDACVTAPATGSIAGSCCGRTFSIISVSGRGGHFCRSESCK